ncbi:phospho-N-acetylmuramoyl-pentapeptide-transferase [Enterobacteriaceae endosymbiont of Donacia bicoloricornis]|uniref:phospho-N-acetylmuramoyl-pentapeptide- transferase n=1 Tax=Enterobacteriaceae endosymbiont of Donacia bicoloricornis TaxID=2675772 RepID=UPI001448D620|nr:phospho-N-acetylmuramoyl-pentapeptide-transferase [Enterobacteriaceae endosymbiont of Donacia bicoloricornis]QJC37675.1 phospho-N-acetylmuramoyl-pentapeptide-transferase [Enterobacteriaceae endosymbiont of Donacia bicoloricornis]
MLLILFKYLQFFLKNLDLFSINFKIRFIMVFFISFIITFFLSPFFINYFNKKKISQIIRKNGPITHFTKNKTPTMGGIILLLAIILSVIFCSDLTNKYIFYSLLIMILYSVVGFIDDFYKIILNNSIGLSIFKKFFFQSICTIAVVSFIYLNNTEKLYIQFSIPFINKVIKYNLNYILYLIISYFIIVGISNSVNLTDGLDGLVIMPIIFISLGLAILCYFSGDIYLSKYFNFIYIKNAKELIIICLAIVGSGLGFLWYNTYPAKIFMGDVGSLSLGCIISIIAILIRQEFLFLIMCGVFILESISVIIQVIKFKYNKKRFFLMAPLHHHYELKGITEPCIIIRFWIISLILVLFSLIIII